MKSHLKRWLSTSPYQVFDSVRKSRRFLADARRIEGIVKCGHSDRLHIGCGGNIFNGWINTDIVKDSSGSFFMDATGSFPIPDNSLRYVYSEHVFEHLDPAGQVKYLRESFRTLAPGGKIRVATPNLERILSLFKDSDEPFIKGYIDWNFKVFIGEKWPMSDKVSSRVEYVFNNYMRDWGHQMIHSRESLSELIILSGFRDLTDHGVGESQEPDLQSLERHDEMIGVENNRFETMIIEAFKPL